MIICETNRLRIRHCSKKDAEFIIRLLNEPSYIANIEDKKVRTIDDAIKYLNDGPIATYQKFGFGLYLVELKETGEPIGMCGLLKRDTLADADLGYSLLKQYWSMGYAKESALAVLKSANHDYGLNRIVAITKIDNLRSSGLLEKLGFSFEGMIEMYGENNKLFALNF
ncbi:alanine acetyltransferase [Thalassotalea insulae]|uniref:Alanine acetyltransferase n=1 Tax=Thalassotalea insulae TaxID=2056778 RepID=A0ABQ6GSP7_9GAMM|nr:GNAT family N-acetyltransferase [Thalassotalea insulae]GLX78975.1 alanine acetyltransferase [Thalassotalea insulae]